jgi:Flp pilus assembly protein TadG
VVLAAAASSILQQPAGEEEATAKSISHARKMEKQRALGGAVEFDINSRCNALFRPSSSQEATVTPTYPGQPRSAQPTYFTPMRTPVSPGQPNQRTLPSDGAIENKSPF